MTIVPIILILAAIGWIVYINLSSREINNRVVERLCLHCGYDLRGNHDRCPECGLECYPRLDLEKLSKQWPAQRLQMEEKVQTHDLTAIVHETLDREQARLLAVQFIRRGVPAPLKRVPFPGQNSLFIQMVCVSEDDKRLAMEMIRKFEPDRPQGATDPIASPDQDI